jgi:hypothetical protein
VKTDIEISTELIVEIIKFVTDPNNKNVIELATKIIDDIIEFSTDIVDKIDK